jgi:hypothetical protein
MSSENPIELDDALDSLERTLDRLLGENERPEGKHRHPVIRNNENGIKMTDWWFC